MLQIAMLNSGPPLSKDGADPLACARPQRSRPILFAGAFCAKTLGLDCRKLPLRYAALCGCDAVCVRRWRGSPPAGMVTRSASAVFRVALDRADISPNRPHRSVLDAKRSDSA